ncbi:MULTISPECIES: DUF397 domain-containing protein [Streptomyces]|uniref:DUF397 domain-containing protein n=2 Tax=Streptomyces TaxID=1883 RepID=A0A1I6W5Y7_9ACTN|nr:MULTISPECIES: DUF397 domain-containing protein [Streptomyces]QKV70359.1 DUF397 domain-containing protein [Streptomyces harbinensis]SFT21405.1 protein of unknown function [Streptomyces harbinensis]
MSTQKGQTADLGDAIWRASRRSQANGACVEVVDGFPGTVPVRDSKQPHRVLLIPTAAWRALISHLRA